MRSDDISQDMMPREPAGQRDIGLRLGTILAWDNLTGANTVDIEGQQFQDLKAIQGGIGIRYTPGDVVVIMKKQTTFFIFGRVASVGGAAGAAVVSDTNNLVYNTGSSGGSFANFPDNGPVVTTYIGSSRRALLIWSADCSVSQSKAEIGWAVSGASTMASGSFAATTAQLAEQTTATVVAATVTGSYVMGSGAGLKTGVNTFTMQYRTELFGGTGANYGNRSLTVIPL